MNEIHKTKLHFKFLLHYLLRTMGLHVAEEAIISLPERAWSST
jgi:hypothetical protein